jgi:phospholipase C
VVSPLIRRNAIDHLTYEHTSIVSTLVRLFDLKDVGRSPFASDLKRLATLDVARTDAPMTLPNPVGAALLGIVKTPLERAAPKQPDKPLADDPTGRIAATIESGLAQHLEVTPPSEHAAIVARVNALQTRGEAFEYLKEVDVLVKAAKAKAGVRKSASVRPHRMNDQLAA